MKRTLKRLNAIIMVVMMVINMLPVSALAEIGEINLKASGARVSTDIQVNYNAPENSDFYYYDDVIVIAPAEGSVGENPIFQWQQSSDGESWTDIVGATSKTYSFAVNDVTFANSYRVLVSGSEDTDPIASAEVKPSASFGVHAKLNDTEQEIPDGYIKSHHLDSSVTTLEGHSDVITSASLQFSMNYQIPDNALRADDNAVYNVWTVPISRFGLTQWTTDAEGIIYSKDNGNTIPSGTYKVDNGVITFTYYQEFMDKVYCNTSGITGDFEIKGDLNLAEGSTQDRVEIKIGETTYYYYPNGIGDMSIAKEVLSADPVSGEVIWKVTISSKTGTFGNYTLDDDTSYGIKLTDTITENEADTRITGITAENGLVAIDENIAYLENLPANGSWVLYVKTQNSNTAALTTKTKNKAVAETKSRLDDISKEAEAEVQVNSSSILNKDVEIVNNHNIPDKEGVQMAKWTITLNPADAKLRANLVGLTLTDENMAIFADSPAGIYSLNITPETGFNRSEDGKSITFVEDSENSGKNLNQYVITFYTDLKVVEGTGEEGAKYYDHNKAILKKNETQIFSDEASYEKSLSAVPGMEKDVTLDRLNGKAYFTLTINKERWPLKEVKITDSWTGGITEANPNGLPDGFSYEEGSGAVYVNDNTTAMTTLNVTDRTTLAGFISAVNSANLSGSNKYTIKYTFNIADDASGSYANVAFLNETYKGEAGVGITDITLYNADKTGDSEEVNDWFKWTVVVNGDHTKMDHWTLADDSLTDNSEFLPDAPTTIVVKNEKDEIIETYPMTGSSMEDVLTRVNSLTESGTNSVTLTYYSSIENLDSVTNYINAYKNGVKVLPADATDDNTASLHATVPVEVSISAAKNYASHVATNDDESLYQINWTATYGVGYNGAPGMDFDIPDDEEKRAAAYILEEPQNSQYFKKSDLDELNFDSLFGAHNWEIAYDEMTKKEGHTDCYTNLKVYYWHVEKNAFNKTISYTTYIDQTDFETIEDGIIRNNTKISVKSDKTATASATFSPKSKVSISKALNSDAQTAGQLNAAYGDRLIYTITTNFGSMDDVRSYGRVGPIITDTLPANVVPERVTIQEIKHGVPSDGDIWSGELSPTVTECKPHGDYYVFKYEDNKITMTANADCGPGGVMDNNNINGLIITIYAKVTDAFVYNSDDGKSATITNEANVSIGQTQHAETYITHTVNQATGNPVITKTGDMSQGSTNTIEYSVTLNPDGKKYLGSNPGERTTLDVVDTLTWRDDRFPLDAITIREGSLQLINLLTGEPLEGVTSNTDSKETDGTPKTRQRIITLQIPDGVPVLMTYKYDVVSTVATTLNLENTVTLNGFTYVDSGSDEGSYDIKKTSGANVSTGLISFTKIKENAEHVLLAGATFKLYKYVNGDYQQVATAVSQQNGKLVFTSVSDSEFSFELNTVYKLEEENAPTGYLANTTPYIFCIGENKDGVEGVVCHSSGDSVKLPNAPETTTVKITKNWENINDDNVQYPTSITFTVYNGSIAVKSKVVNCNEDGSWTNPTYVEFDGLEKYDSQGRLIHYTVNESVQQYFDVQVVDDENITEIDNIIEATITNRYVPVTVSGSKTWEDNNNQDGKRPTSITITLYKSVDGSEAVAVDGVAPKTYSGDAMNNASWTFENLPKYEDGKEITYTVVETMTDHEADYVASYDDDHLNVTNSHTPETIDIPVTKTWENDLWGNKCPESIDVYLYDDTDPDYIQKITITEQDNWKGSFTGLPKYRNEGKEIQYHVVEDVPTGFTPDIDGDNEGFILNNCLTKIDIKVDKEWLNGKDNGAPDLEVTVYLLNNGEKIMKDGEVRSETIGKLNKDNDWTYTFENLPEYIDGKKAIYTVEEEAVAGYQQTGKTGSVDDGFVITNTELTEAEVVKVWDDANNQDNERPVTLTVKLLADGKETDKSVTLSENNNWTDKITGLLKYTDDDEEIIYTWKEESLTAGYTLTGNITEETVTTLTNSYTLETVVVEGSKTWNDNNNQDGKRPASITISLLADGEAATYQDGQAVEAIKVEADNDGNWSWKFKNLPKYKVGAVGKEIVYKVVEDEVAEYTTTYSETGYDVTNTHIPDTVVVEGSKTWIDKGNETQRPESITIRVWADGEEATYQNGATVEPIITTADKDWKWSFTNLPKYKVGNVDHELTYTITEDAIYEGETETKLYDTVVNGYNVTNTISQRFTELEGKKIWIDGNDEADKRPASIIIHLYRDGKQIDEKIVTEEDGWSWKFDELAVYAVDVTDKGAYSYDDADGHTFAYTVSEDEVPAYTTSQTGNDFTNTIAQDYTDVIGEKTWIDYENEDGKRPASITVNLLRDGVEIDEVTVGEEEGWAWEFKDLPMYAVESIDGKTVVYPYEARDGHTFKYTITEDVVAEYTTEIEGFDVTNTLKQDYIKVEGTKTWNNNFQLGYLYKDGFDVPAITINLYRDDEKTPIASVVLESTTITEDKAVRGYVFENLPKYAVSCDKLKDYEGDLDGHTFKYTVKEVLPDGYKQAFNEQDTDDTDKRDFVNTLVTTKVEGTKTWIYYGDKELELYPEITIELYANDKYFTSQKLEKGDTEYLFDDLPKYDPDGKEIEYTVKEVLPDEFSNGFDQKTDENGRNFINTLKTIRIEGEKIWEGNGNTITETPAITIQLMRRIGEGEAEVIDTRSLPDGTTTFSFDNLPEYAVPCDVLKDVGQELLTGEKITYWVEEVLEDDHDHGYDSEENPDEVGFINTLIVTEVKGTKTWDDKGNEIEHPDVTIELYRDDEATPIATRTLKNGNTEYAFENLPKYAVAKTNGENGYAAYEGELDGHEFIYTVKEVVPHGYTSEQDDKDFANTLETVEVNGTKTWVDKGNEFQRPETITINLLRDNTQYKTTTITKDVTKDTFEYSFTNLPKYAIEGLKDAKESDVLDGHEFVYTVAEVEVEDYTDKIDGYDVTNTITQKFTSMEGKKTWIDGEDEAEKRPDSITINLLRDDVEIAEAIVTEETGWSWKFDELAVYAVDVENKGNYNYTESDGHTFKYTVTEDEVEGYTTEQVEDGFINTIVQDYTKVDGTKTWIDPEGTEHPAITINLLRDGVEIAEVELTNGQTTYEFTNLPVYAVPSDELTGYTGNLDGHVFKYTVTEDAVEGYTSEQDETDFVNTIVQDYTKVDGTKTWIDPEGTEHPAITINLLRDGVEIAEVELTNGQTTYEFTNLPVYAVPCDELTGYTDELDGHVFEYSVTEDAVAGYTSKQNGTSFTNTIKQDYTEVEGTKTWIDPEGTEHLAITINLLRDGVEIAEVVLTNGQTTYEFTNLPVYAVPCGELNSYTGELDGHVFEYSVTEDAVAGYTTVQNGTSFTNTIKQDYIKVAGTKTWVDPEGTEHPEITINLMQDGAEIAEIKLANGVTEYSFNDLPKYAPDGHIYEYTVSEDVVPGYTSEQNGTSFTNVIAQEYIDITVNKVWNDNGAVGVEHPTIRIYLYCDGERIDVVYLPNNSTSYTITNLPKYNLATGAEYVYTVGEREVEGYRTFINGYTITNTSTAPAVVTISGTKTWMDDGRDHDNASEIQLVLKRSIDGGAEEEVTDAQVTWHGNTYYFYNQLRNDAAGNAYSYRVEELPIEGYATFYEGSNIINRLRVEVLPVEIAGTKHWIDDDNAAGLRPESITVLLLRDGELIDSVTVSEADNWMYAFTDLPDNDGFGDYYTYTVSEQLVPRYWMRTEGYDLYNTIRTEAPVPNNSVYDLRAMNENDLEELITILDYNVPLWGGLLGTGDEIPVYPFVFCGIGMLALVAFIVLNRKGKRT